MKISSPFEETFFVFLFASTLFPERREGRTFMYRRKLLEAVPPASLLPVDGYFLIKSFGSKAVARVEAKGTNWIDGVRDTESRENASRMENKASTRVRRLQRESISLSPARLCANLARGECISPAALFSRFRIDFPFRANERQASENSVTKLSCYNIQWE